MVPKPLHGGAREEGAGVELVAGGRVERGVGGGVDQDLEVDLGAAVLGGQ